jgi:ankyrin repeat protein
MHAIARLQACRNNLVQHLEHLLAYGADMNSKNSTGNTPLHGNCERESFDLRII